MVCFCIKLGRLEKKVLWCKKTSSGIVIEVVVLLHLFWSFVASESGGKLSWLGTALGIGYPLYYQWWNWTSKTAPQSISGWVTFKEKKGEKNRFFVCWQGLTCCNTATNYPYKGILFWLCLNTASFILLNTIISCVVVPRSSIEGKKKCSKKFSKYEPHSQSGW